jgi:hypothetical protein
MRIRDDIDSMPVQAEEFQGLPRSLNSWQDEGRTRSFCIPLSQHCSMIFRRPSISCCGSWKMWRESLLCRVIDANVVGEAEYAGSAGSTSLLGCTGTSFSGFSEGGPGALWWNILLGNLIGGVIGNGGKRWMSEAGSWRKEPLKSWFKKFWSQEGFKGLDQII